MWHCVASFDRVQVVCKPLHHFGANVDVLRSIVSCAHAIALKMPKLHFDDVTIPLVFVQDG